MSPCTFDQLADALTKPLSRQQHKLLHDKIGDIYANTILQGHDKDQELSNLVNQFIPLKFRKSSIMFGQL